MQFPCQKIGINKAPLGPNGLVEPLCDSCVNYECSNPIQKRKISIMGVTKERRIFVSGHDGYFVVSCEGFIPIGIPEEGEEGADL